MPQNLIGAVLLGRFWRLEIPSSYKSLSELSKLIGIPMSELRKGYRGLSADDKLIVRNRVSDNFSELLYFFQSGWSQGLDEQVALVKELYEEKQEALKQLKRKAHDQTSKAKGKSGNEKSA